MEARQRTIAALLTVISVLLSINLIVSASRPAGAQVDGPVLEPTPIALAVRSNWVYRLWSDGAVDLTQLTVGPDCVTSLECPTTTVLPGICPGDVNKSGDVGFDDILEVIGMWGPCPPAWR